MVDHSNNNNDDHKDDQNDDPDHDKDDDKDLDQVHHQLDMAVVAILSHGENGSIICTNGEKVLSSS